MKALKIIHFLILLALNTFLTTRCSTQSNALKTSETKQLLENKNFVFVAESVTPLAGRMRQLTSEYRLIISQDSLDSHLPYFGTAYNVPYGSSASPLIFTSSDFTYTFQQAKNGRFDVTIRLNKPNDPDLIILSVSPNGYGRLQVNSVNRQPISFYGHVRANGKLSGRTRVKT